VLEGKRIVVTGAGRGIGRAIAAACLKAGATVGVNYVTSEEGAKTLSAEFPSRAHLLRFDVSDPQEVKTAVEQFRSKAGGIDGWVNNAGIILPDLLVAADLEKIRLQIAVNLLGPMICAQAVLPFFMEQRRGVILNVSSVAAVRPARGQSVYAATKGGLESLTRALAVEYGRKGIRVHGIRPGPIDTPMLEATMSLAEEEILSRIPLRRIGKPDDVAELALFLLSERSSFMTGSIHTVDGGYLEG